MENTAVDKRYTRQELRDKASEMLKQNSTPAETNSFLLQHGLDQGTATAMIESINMGGQYYANKELESEKKAAKKNIINGIILVAFGIGAVVAMYFATDGQYTSLWLWGIMLVGFFFIAKGAYYMLKK